MGLYALFDPTDYITSASGYSMFAETRFGSNGTGLVPENVVGTPYESLSGEATWDDDLSDGLHSSDGFSFDGNLQSGLIEFGTEVIDCGIASWLTPQSYTVGSVIIKAAAAVPAIVGFSDLTIRFYCDDTLMDTVNVTGGVVADSTDASTGVEEQILMVTPSVSGCNRVSVFGVFEMQAGPDVYPGWNDLFGQILIMPGA